MEILETVPIYTGPDWPFFLIVGGLILLGVSAILYDTEWVGCVILILAIIMVFTGIITALIYRNTIFSHNEYVVRISDISVNEFIENYEITKRFEYSDVVQVKEIVKK
jgi:fatty-acid desaturase